jgi:phosphomannomutase
VHLDFEEVSMAGIFKAYDIRGLYPDEISERTVEKIGFAFARFLKGSHIVIGRDMRDSSLALSLSFADGVLSAGTDVHDVGMATTPMLYYAIIDGKFDGGAMISASHLGAQYNGIKLCRQQAIPLSGDSGLPEVESLTSQVTELPSKTGHYRTFDFLGRYVDTLARFLENPRPLKIVVDAGNGMGGLDAPLFFARFPDYQIVPMFMEIDGDFPNHVPNPAIAANTRALQQRVLAENADVGIAFDGDGDRCGFVDEQGNRVPADLVIAVLAEYFLHKRPGATILYDLRASRVVPERIRELGGNPVMTRVGHSYIKQKMREVDGIFAGELSGHYYYQEMGTIDSGILSMISMLNVLALKQVPLSQIIRPLQKYARSGEINVEVQDAKRVFRDLEEAYRDGEQTHLDGLTVTYPHWWFNLRKSHTEPVVRLVVEAENEEVLQGEQDRLLAIIKKTS